MEGKEMTVATVQASQPEFSRGLDAFKRVMDAPRVRVVEKIHALPLTVTVATILRAVK